MSKSSKKKPNISNGRIEPLVLMSVILLVAIFLSSILSQSGGMEGEEVAGNQEETTQPTYSYLFESPEGLAIQSISSYTGTYVEDGTDEPVSEVMMIVLENTASQMLQLARIDIEYPDFTAEFEMTNIPSGEKVVVLEKNRHPAVSEKYLSIESKNVVFFPDTVGLQEDRVDIKGSDGILQVKNISDKDISEKFYIYYKNFTKEMFYGGITYRVAVRGGLKAGESTQIIASHYTPDNSQLVMVDCGE